MEHTSGVLALMGALLLGGGGESRLERLTAHDVAHRSARATWSKPLGARAVPVLAGSEHEPRASSGRFTMLSYNVAGLPSLVSPSRPEVNVPLISPLLNHYDVALVQEDFSYHRELDARAEHPYRSDTMRRSLALMPDGLNQFSRFAMGWTHRVRWNHCHGYFGHASDCLADKGFSYTQLTLSDGVTVDVYNLHADAGGSANDVRARRANFEQLTAYVRERSRGNAVIIAGDTNVRTSRRHDASTLSAFVSALGLTEACDRSACGEERLDRIFFRSSDALELDVAGWWTDVRFVDDDGEPLSDHPAIGVEIRWRLLDQEPPLMAETRTP